MAQSFTCPSCGAPLDYEGGGDPVIQCPYCFTSVIVPQELRYQKAEPVSSELTLSLKGQAARLRELANLVRAGQRDKAAEIYRQIYQVSLPEAQRVVSQLSGSGAVVLTSGPVVGPLPGAISNAESLTPASPLMTNPANYSVQPPQVMVYSTTASQGQQAQGMRAAIWIFVIIILVTTVLPTVLSFVVFGCIFLFGFLGAIASAFR